MLILDRRRADPAYVVQARVIWAIIIRDIRTRFFGHGLGYLIAIAWPLVHILVLLVIYGLTGRVQPVGSSLALFFATGLVPYISFIYIARFTMQSMSINKALVHLPIVKITDIVFARAILEFFASCCMTMLLLIIFYVLDIDVAPRDLSPAYAALGASMLLGLGFGMVNAMIIAAIPGWMLIFIALQIILYMTSGIVFMADMMPEGARRVVAYNPIFHGVEWMRSAYFEGYDASSLDKNYLIGWGIGLLFTGLLTERLVRGRILQG